MVWPVQSLFLLGLATIKTSQAIRVDLDCQAVIDDYCRETCDLRSRGCDYPTVARYSGKSGNATDFEWRCYSPSTLDNNQTYHGGDCYCSRGDEIQEALSLCFNDVTTVFSTRMAGEHCYRIPTIIRLAQGALLAFAEQRDRGCGDGGSNNLVMRRSTDDGQTWGDLITIAEGGGAPFSNPNPVEVDLGDHKLAVLLHYDTMNNPSSAHHGSNMQIWSYDGGATWVNRTNISAFMPEGYAGCMPGPSVGVQSPDGTIYFSCHGFGVNGFLYWSRDLGRTWRASKVLNSLNECSIALLVNTSVAMNCRTAGSFREQLTWAPDGSLLGEIRRPAGLVDPNCQGSLLAHAGALYLSNDNTTSGRTHIVVKRSADGGLSWDEGRLIWAGPAAYSQLVGMGDTRLGLLFELGVETTYESIGFRSWAVDG